MTLGHGPVQPGWGNPNRGWRTTYPDDPFDGRWGLRATTASSAGREKGMGAAPTLPGVVRAKAVVDLQGQPPGNGGADLHDDHDGGGDVDQRQHAGVQHRATFDARGWLAGRRWTRHMMVTLMSIKDYNSSFPSLTPNS
jgi:hypothetical protein